MKCMQEWCTCADCIEAYELSRVFKEQHAMPKDDVKEWAIQDEATGEWYLAKVGGGFAVSPKREELATGSYGGCARMPPFDTSYPQYRDTARIVPAPPREMTDAECWEWLHAQYKNGAGRSLGIFPAHTDAKPHRWSVGDHPEDYAIALGVTPCDAIRAARKKLAGK